MTELETFFEKVSQSSIKKMKLSSKVSEKKQETFLEGFSKQKEM
jgi:hypothetical protein